MSTTIKEYLQQTRRRRWPWAYSALCGLCGYHIHLWIIDRYSWLVMDRIDFNGFIDLTFISIIAGFTCFFVWLENFADDVV